MENQFTKVESITGQRYVMIENEDTELRSTLSWKGRQIYTLIKEQQPERFKEMKQDKTLVPFLEKISHQWFLNMREHQHNGMPRDVAEEIEWKNLIEAAGLE